MRIPSYVTAPIFLREPSHPILRLDACNYKKRHGKTNHTNEGCRFQARLEAKLWAAADALRNNMDAAEYKHVVLGLILLKYISDAFETMRSQLEAQRSEGADPEDPDEYRASNIFWVPKEARWEQLKANTPQATIAKFVDDAIAAIASRQPVA